MRSASSPASRLQSSPVPLAIARPSLLLHGSLDLRVHPELLISPKHLILIFGCAWAAGILAEALLQPFSFLPMSQAGIISEALVGVDPGPPGAFFCALYWSSWSSLNTRRRIRQARGQIVSGAAAVRCSSLLCLELVPQSLTPFSVYVSHSNMGFAFFPFVFSPV